MSKNYKSFEKKNDDYTHFLNNKFPEEEKNNYINEVSNFRNILMGDTDFFGDVCNKYLEAKKYAFNK